MSRLKEVLAFVNNKGGVGKTTTVQNVAVGLLRLELGHDARTCFDDGDGDHFPCFGKDLGHADLLS